MNERKNQLINLCLTSPPVVMPGGDPQTSVDAPVPLSRADKEGSIAWGTPAAGAAFRMFKLMLKTPNHWQLDGHVRLSAMPVFA